jgi:hypothetical protein
MTTNVIGKILPLLPIMLRSWPDGITEEVLLGGFGKTLRTWSGGFTFVGGTTLAGFPVVGFGVEGMAVVGLAVTSAVVKTVVGDFVVGDAVSPAVRVRVMIIPGTGVFEISVAGVDTVAGDFMVKASVVGVAAIGTSYR